MISMYVANDFADLQNLQAELFVAEGEREVLTLFTPALGQCLSTRHFSHSVPCQ